jgi:hypothetical protein
VEHRRPVRRLVLHRRHAPGGEQLRRDACQPRADLDRIASAAGLVNNCEGTFGLICGATTYGDPLSKWRGSARVTFATGAFTTSLLYRYVGKARDDDPGSLYWVERFGDKHYYDLTFNYQVNEIFDFTLRVENLFDNDPPPFAFRAIVQAGGRPGHAQTASNTTVSRSIRAEVPGG